MAWFRHVDLGILVIAKYQGTIVLPAEITCGFILAIGRRTVGERRPVPGEHDVVPDVGHWEGPPSSKQAVIVSTGPKVNPVRSTASGSFDPSLYGPLWWEREGMYLKVGNLLIGREDP